MEWIEKTLGELGDIVGGATPSTKHEEYYGGDIAWITPKDLSLFKGRYISCGERSITEAGLASCSAQMMPSNTVLFTSRAPIGYVAIARQSVCTNQGFKSVVPHECVDPLFLYYILKFNKERIEAMGSGTTFKEVSGKTMKAVQVRVPCKIEDQKKIASILDSIDSKIENNAKINDNLQQQAQAIYQSLFVSFDGIPTNQLIDSELGLMPVGWTVKSLSEVTTSIRTKVQDNDYKVLSAINTGQLQLSEEHFNKQVFSKNISNYIVVEPFDFAYNPARINIGSIGMNTLGLTGCVSPVYVVIRTEPGYHHFFDFFVKTKRFSEEVKTRASGSVRQSLNNVDFGQIKVAYPPIDAVERFNREYTVRLKIMEQLKTENEKLVSIRDSLLPKLMSGEIDVSDVKL